MQSLSIVVPVYNRANLVTKTLDSIIRQTHLPNKLILVDNNSTDDTLSILNQWAKDNESKGMVICVTSEKLPGATAARNTGFMLADTEWVMFFDSDDIMLPNHVERALDGASCNPAAQIIGWDIQLNTLDNRHVKKPFSNKDLLYNCIMHGTMATQRYMVKCELARKAGLWNTNLPAWNDIEFGVRLIKQTKNKEDIAYVKGRPSVEVNAQVESITGTNYSSRAEAYNLSIDTIEKLLSPSERWIIDMKRAVLCGLLLREKQNELAYSLWNKIQTRTFLSLLKWRFARVWTAANLPGAAKILRPLFNFKER